MTIATSKKPFDYEQFRRDILWKHVNLRWLIIAIGGIGGGLVLIALVLSLAGFDRTASAHLAGFRSFAWYIGVIAVLAAVALPATRFVNWWFLMKADMRGQRFRMLIEDWVIRPLPELRQFLYEQRNLKDSKQVEAMLDWLKYIPRDVAMTGVNLMVAITEFEDGLDSGDKMELITLEKALAEKLEPIEYIGVQLNSIAAQLNRKTRDETFSDLCVVFRKIYGHYPAADGAPTSSPDDHSDMGATSAT